MKNANQVLALPDQRTYYNSVQLSLPVNTLLALDQEDEVFSFLEAVKGVDFSKYVKPIRSNNTNSHDRGMLIRTMLFGYMNGINTLSTLVSLCRTDLRYLFLSNEDTKAKRVVKAAAFEAVLSCFVHFSDRKAKEKSQLTS